MRLSEDEKTVIKLRATGATVKEIIKALRLRNTDSNKYKIEKMVASLIKRGLVEKKKRGPNPKREIPEDEKPKFKKEVFLGCTCKYEGCRTEASRTYALVPLCANHHDLIDAETLEYYEADTNYKKRLHFFKIIKLIPWSLLATNSRLKAKKKSGIVGVTYSSKTGAWQANLTIDGKYTYLGIHDTPKLASDAIEKKKKELGMV